MRARVGKLILAPSGPLILSPKTAGQSVLWSWCGGNVARPNVDTVPTFVGNASQVASQYGSGFALTGGTDRATYQRGVPLASLLGGFTIEVLCAITAVTSLAGFVALKYINSGSQRGLISFGGGTNSNIYFWGAGLDLTSGVDWRTDGLPQHVFVTSASGSSSAMTFYRDGLSIASGTTPAGLIALTDSGILIGDTNQTWFATPTGTIHKAAYYDRCLTASEIWEKTQDPYGDYLPLGEQMGYNINTTPFIPSIISPVIPGPSQFLGEWN